MAIGCTAAPLSGAAASLSGAACTPITASDGLFIVDTQNDFMEAYPLPSTGTKPQYPIPRAGLAPGGKAVAAGSLAVGNTSQIVVPINAWIEHFGASGGRVFASLDWHPAQHCSFCRNGTAASNPSGFQPKGDVCGPLPLPGFNSTGRCVDMVAKADYGKHSLMQWPDHCVHGSFGSRFQPFLRVPANATVIKKGWDGTIDTYSAFGGTESLQAYPFDTSDAALQLKGRATLSSLLAAQGIKRLWVVGIATDYCVGGTVLDALGKNEDTKRPAPKGLKLVVMAEASTRAVSTKTGSAMIAAISAAGGVVVKAVDPAAAIAEACAK